MKKLIILAILASSHAFGQISVSPFFATTLGKNDAKFKDKIGHGFALSYDFNENCGITAQAKSWESWDMAAQTGRIITLKTLSLQFYIFQCTKNDSRWFFRPSGGVLAGVGSPIDNKNQNPAALRESVKLMEHPYFFGVLLEAGAGYKLSPQFSLSTYVKEEAIVGKIADRDVVSENFTTISNLLLGLRLTYFFQKNKNPHHD